MKTNEEITLDFFSNMDDIFWLELDIEFDLRLAQEELKNLEKYFVSHRDNDSYKHRGWSSCTLHGLGINITENWDKYYIEKPNHDWTELVNVTPTMYHFWKNIFPADTYNRIRFMNLNSKGYISPHSDHDPNSWKNYNIFKDGIAVNLAITHPNDCFFKFGDRVVPWAPGKVILMNISKEHSVVNHSNYDRTHMIAHAWPAGKSKEFSDLVVRSLKKNGII